MAIPATVSRKEIKPMRALGQFVACPMAALAKKSFPTISPGVLVALGECSECPYHDKIVRDMTTRQERDGSRLPVVTAEYVRCLSPRRVDVLTHVTEYPGEE